MGDSCFCNHLSPCQALAEALEENSTLTDLNLEGNVGIDSETREARCFRGRGSALLGARAPGLPKRSYKVLQKPPSKIL